MKIRAITLDNVRRFTAPVQVTGLSDGLNVLCEPNEHGKSTLFDALQALFFKPFGSRDKEVQALRPHAGGAPEVTVEVETAEGLFRITKRWMQKPIAEVHQGTTLKAQADAAEAWISDLLGADGSGPSGLIWVRQGVTDLVGGNAREQKAALEARRDLMTSVGHEVEAMTGGRRMDAALARCREELATYATNTGKPKASGPWKAAQDSVATLETQRDTLEQTARELRDDLSARTRARRELAEWQAPEAVAERRARLDQARAAHATAQRHAEELDALARQRDMARMTVDNARARRDSLVEVQAEFTEARRLLEAASVEAQAQQAALAAAQAARDSAQEALDRAEQQQALAEKAHAAAVQAQAARDGAQRRKELADRIARAEDTQKALQTAAAAITGPTAAVLSRLEALSSSLATAQAARNAAASQVTVSYLPGRSSGIRIDGSDLPEGAAQALPRRTTLEIEGIGQLDFRPGAADEDDTSVQSARDALRKALDAAEVETLDAARTLAAARAEAERQHGEAKAVLASLAPDGIDALRAALAGIPEPTEGSDQPDPAATEAALITARTARDAARIAAQTAVERLSDARTEAMRADTALGSLRERVARAEAALSRLGDASIDALTTELAKAEEALRSAETSHAAKAETAPDLASTEAALKRATSVEETAQAEINRLQPLLARLEERISRASGEAVEERLAETVESLGIAQATLDRIAHEVTVLQRLEQVLQAAQSEARERYFSPIARELKPLLHLLWPEAQLTWGEDSLLPEVLIREGREEPIDILSGGTQEQLALLVRLAFARLLAKAGRSAPVILDDALVYTDDDRIERMFDALHRQAGDLQIIVLSCRQRAFRGLGGNALRLQQTA